MLITDADLFDAEQAFTRALRARRRAALARWLRREPARHGQLRVLDRRALASACAQPGRGIREIPLEAIRGTLEPGRAMMFDRGFRPAASARSRWQGVWLAERRGEVLPAIAVIAVDDSYVISDGHHRVSVARARGALTIDAIVETAWRSVAGRWSTSQAGFAPRSRSTAIAALLSHFGGQGRDLPRPATDRPSCAPSRSS
jgi:hypothetical protein